MSDTDQALHALLRLQKRLIGRGSGASCCTDVKIVKIREDFQKIKDTLAKLVAERDEARRDAERWQADALRLLTERNAAQEERDELVSIADKASKERDEARREICSTVVFPSSPQEYANRRGWECFGEHGK